MGFPQCLSFVCFTSFYLLLVNSSLFPYFLLILTSSFYMIGEDMNFFSFVRKAKEAGGGPVEKILGEGDSSAEVPEKKVPRRRKKKSESESGTTDVPDVSDAPAESGQSEGLQEAAEKGGVAEESAGGEEGGDEPLVGLKPRKRKLIKTSDPAVAKKARAVHCHVYSCYRTG
ncbi:hypothetical protein Dimus_038415 [Dionaea muscipula]